VKTATHAAAHLLVSVPLTVIAHLVVTVMSVLHITAASVPNVQPMEIAPNALVTSVLSVPHMEIVLLVEIDLLTVTVVNVPLTTVESALSVPHLTAAMTDLLMVTDQSVLALIAMHLVANVPLTEIVLLVEIVPRMATVMSAPLTTAASVPNAQLSIVVNALSVLPTVTVTNALLTTAESAQIVLLMATATSVLLVTSVETVPVTTKTKLLAVPLQTSTLLRMRRHASLLKRTSYSSVSKHRQPPLLMLMA
jgi:hypothetical protein